ncbi:hypothetical protein EWM64_g7407, partial [Hericium alpestre]
MVRFLEPLLTCFTDPENRVRYFSAECLYNIAKVSKGEVLVYFNPIFDALSKLAADPELSVKNGAELLDRLLKDIVAESASFYVPHYPETEKVRQLNGEDANLGIVVAHPDEHDAADRPGAKRAFSLARFIPLLSDRIYVISPFTRSFLVSWITVLDSVPELELITYLPEFFDGLLKYLSDPTEDVRIATENQLGEFLREIRDVTVVRKQQEEQQKHMESAVSEQPRPEGDNKNADLKSAFLKENESSVSDELEKGAEPSSQVDEMDTGGMSLFLLEKAPLIWLTAWIPGQGVQIHYDAIIEILIQQLDGQHDEIQQSTALIWFAEFLSFAPEVMVPFTPRLIPSILPNLAHHVPMIQTAANRTNKLLASVIKALPVPSEGSSRQSTVATSDRTSATRTTISPPPPVVPKSPAPSRQSTLSSQTNQTNQTNQNGQTGQSRDTSSPESLSDVTPTATTAASGLNVPSGLTLQKRASVQLEGTVPRVTTIPEGKTVSPALPPAELPTARPHSPVPFQQQQQQPVQQDKEKDKEATPSAPADAFDYQATVNALTIQFLSEHEETRVAALKWLIMLHQKVPKKILAMDDGTFPALLKTLSDTSEEACSECLLLSPAPLPLSQVIKHDLQLLAQISSSSEESYFKAFMINLLELFSTDRRLLDTRGSLIIRQLCLNLNTEKIYRTFAEILEKEEDLEFASVIVQKLNMILITSPELADFRKRLKSLETRQDGQALFITLYRSWCHNAVAVFSLCLLSQSYEHASNLLTIFADLEITVPLLVQIDRLVQLIESPVFTYLRLQLLEPDRYPYLFKCLYGLLMLLPQSSAFISLRNRLNAVNSAGFLHIAPKPPPSAMSTRSKLAREEIKWGELLSHFRAVQIKHEKARRAALGGNLDISDTLPHT